MKFLVRSCAALAVILSSLDSSAAPRVLNACSTVTESGAYVVGRNLNATGDCFVIAADFVNLDFDGAIVRGNGNGAAVSQTLVTGAGRRGIVVRNGFITGFVDGVSLDPSSGVRVENMTVSGNSAVGLKLGDSAAAVNNTVTGNHDGIMLGIRGLATGNNVSNNVNQGISAGIGGNVSGNTVGQNGATGIFVGEGALVSNNVSRSNSTGISALCPSLVIGNTATNNAVNLSAGGGECAPDSAACCVSNVHNMTLQ
jgi:hypothetical protein